MSVLKDPVDELRTPGHRRLRELTGEEFHQLYGCDRVTATILSNRFRYVVSHMASQLRTHAFSPIIRDAADLCGMFSGPPHLGFPMAAVSETVPLFYGSIPVGVRIALEEYGLDRLVPGDTVMVNDYYRVGTHFNDVCNIRPIFYHGELVGAVTIRAHMQDIGGAWPLGTNGRRNTWQDGLRIPPTLLYAAGEPVPSTFKLLYDNTRLGHLIVPDLKTMFHALNLGQQLLADSMEKYGVDAVNGAIRYTCDAAAEAMGDAIEALPDGVYEGEEWIDGDGLPHSTEYGVKIRITIRGSRAEFDLRGSSPASRSEINCAWPDVMTGIAMALKLLIDQAHPMTSGTLRNVDAVVPPDAIFNPRPPHACFGYYEVVMLIVHAIYRALNPVLGPDAVTASKMTQVATSHTYGPNGEEILTSAIPAHSQCGPWGATRHADGDSHQQPVFQNLMMTGGIETFEYGRIGSGLPVVVLASEYVTDTGGPGANRGGAANAHDHMFLREAEHHSWDLHARRPIAGGGVYGGRSGPTGTVWLWDAGHTEGGTTPVFLPTVLHHQLYKQSEPRIGQLNLTTNEADPEGEFLYRIDRPHMPVGTIVRHMTQGGGGWGSPFDRDPERVRADVRDEYVSVEGAAEDYGVVIVGDPAEDPEGLTVDYARTESLRAALRGHRSTGSKTDY
jgi:N-methylhydantoinase B